MSPSASVYIRGRRSLSNPREPDSHRATISNLLSSTGAHESLYSLGDISVIQRTTSVLDLVSVTQTYFLSTLIPKLSNPKESCVATSTLTEKEQRKAFFLLRRACGKYGRLLPSFVIKDEIERGGQRLLPPGVVLRMFVGELLRADGEMRSFLGVSGTSESLSH